MVERFVPLALRLILILAAPLPGRGSAAVDGTITRWPFLDTTEATPVPPWIERGRDLDDPVRHHAAGDERRAVRRSIELVQHNVCLRQTCAPLLLVATRLGSAGTRMPMRA